MALFITGAASGIGRHLVGAFLARGERVAATDLSREALAAVAAEDGWGDGVWLHALDVRDARAWDAAWDAAEALLGPIDRLINNAGYLAPDWLERVSDADIERHFDVNAKGVVYGTRAAARRMVPRGRGHIVNMGSLASLAPVPGLSLYAASKFAVRGFSLSAGLELADKGVAVTVLLPDAVQTPMLDLQKPRPEAALTFSGVQLTPADIDAALVRVFRERPLEHPIPASRAALAKLAALLPDVGKRILPLMRALGRRRQGKRG